MVKQNREMKRKFMDSKGVFHYYYLCAIYPTKEEAKNNAKKLKKDNYSVRIIKGVNKDYFNNGKSKVYKLYTWDQTNRGRKYPIPSRY